MGLKLLSGQHFVYASLFISSTNGVFFSFINCSRHQTHYTVSAFILCEFSDFNTEYTSLMNESFKAVYILQRLSIRIHTNLKGNMLSAIEQNQIVCLSRNSMMSRFPFSGVCSCTERYPSGIHKTSKSGTKFFSTSPRI